MVILLWFTIYWKWFAVGAAVPLVIHFYKIIKEAKAERKEEAEFKEIEASCPVQIDTVVSDNALVVVEETPREVVRQELNELTTSEVEYVEKDESEVCLKREKVTSMNQAKPFSPSISGLPRMEWNCRSEMRGYGPAWLEREHTSSISPILRPSRLHLSAPLGKNPRCREKAILWSSLSA